MGRYELCRQSFADAERHTEQCTVDAALYEMRLRQETLGVERQSDHRLRHISNHIYFAVRLLEDTPNVQPPTVSDRILSVRFIVGDAIRNNDLCSHFPQKDATPSRDCHCTEQQMSPSGTPNRVMQPMSDLRDNNRNQQSVWLISQWYRVANAIIRLPLADMSIESFRDDRFMESSCGVLGERDAGEDLREHNIRLPFRFGLVVGTRRTASEMGMQRYVLHVIERGMHVGINIVES